MNIGDRVRINTSDTEHTGVLMPNEETDTIVLKLDSGYNIGIEKKNIKSEIVLEKVVKKKHSDKPIKHSKKKPTIAVLHTGGTIASKVDYESGGVTAKFSAADLIEMVPELSKIANIETELVANMMSEDMTFADHQKIAKSVQKWAKKDIKGVIIGHGTDTLGYTAAALSFVFEKINIPVLIVGSQRSSDRGSSDAASNLIGAAEFIVKTDYAGIATALHYNTNDDKIAIIPGTNARKMHTSRRDAFKAVNTKPLALVDYKSNIIDYLQDYPKSEGDAVIKSKFSDKVGFFKTHPSMATGVFEYYTKHYDAIVIEGTGLGHAPTNQGSKNLKNFEILKQYIKKGCIVCMTSQCIYGRVHPFVYTNLRRLSSIGVIYCEDMLPETAYIKLSWLLANYPKKAAEMMTQNLRGEINPRHTE